MEEKIEDISKEINEEINEEISQEVKKDRIISERNVKFSIILKPSHMFDFLIRHTYSSFSGMFGVVISLVCLLIFIFTFRDNETFKNIVLLVLASLFTIINPIQLWVKAQQQVKLNPMFKIPLDYIIDENQIIVSQGEEEIEVPFENIVRVMETKKSIIMYTSRIHAYICPKEQISEQEKFRELLKEKIETKFCKLKNNEG